MSQVPGSASGERERNPGGRDAGAYAYLQNGQDSRLRMVRMVKIPWTWTTGSEI